MTRLVRTLVVVFASVLLLAACGGSDGSENGTEEEALAGYWSEPVPTVGELTLPAANRDTDAFAFKAEADKLLVVTFGFTSCPDICPTTLADTRLAFNELGELADDVDLAWVSVDPERDDAAAVTNYVEAFIDDGIGLRTDDELELALAADAFGVTYLFEEDDQGEVQVAHTANVYVVDDTGSIILTWPFGVPAADMTNDLEILLGRIAT